MIHGAHVIIYSQDAEADRAFFRDVLGYPFADAGEGWLIFALPPTELGVHPGEKNDLHEFYFMCTDAEAFAAQMAEHGVPCSDIRDEGFGRMMQLTLPGGGKLGVYQPQHASPLDNE